MARYNPSPYDETAELADLKRRVEILERGQRVPFVAGTGAPDDAVGRDGQLYFREDGGLNTTIYQKRAGSWVALQA